MTKAVLERALDAEMIHHLGYEKGDPPGTVPGTPGTASPPKTVSTSNGPVELAVPRDRNGSFEPAIVPKRARRLGNIDEATLSLYSRGMTTRDIESHLREVYGVNVSRELISNVTEVVTDEIALWQSRPLDEMYLILYVDGLRLRIQDKGVVTSKVAYLAIGVDMEGRKHALGLPRHASRPAAHHRSLLRLCWQEPNPGLLDGHSIGEAKNVAVSVLVQPAEGLYRRGQPDHQPPQPFALGAFRCAGPSAPSGGILFYGKRPASVLTILERWSVLAASAWSASHAFRLRDRDTRETIGVDRRLLGRPAELEAFGVRAVLQAETDHADRGFTPVDVPAHQGVCRPTGVAPRLVRDFGFEVAGGICLGEAVLRDFFRLIRVARFPGRVAVTELQILDLGSLHATIGKFSGRSHIHGDVVLSRLRRHAGQFGRPDDVDSLDLYRQVQARFRGDEGLTGEVGELRVFRAGLGRGRAIERYIAGGRRRVGAAAVTGTRGDQQNKSRGEHGQEPSRHVTHSLRSM
ncbi:transposase [Amycolatopsis sp. NPDC051071]|uniref:IS256 family transposase n=1 Tax=Amycolatopsis sp. NPDC051071 TaxID=3154637 RepID=UPI00342FAE64